MNWKAEKTSILMAKQKTRNKKTQMAQVKGPVFKRLAIKKYLWGNLRHWQRRDRPLEEEWDAKCSKSALLLLRAGTEVNWKALCIHPAAKIMFHDWAHTHFC